MRERKLRIKMACHSKRRNDGPHGSRRISDHGQQAPGTWRSSRSNHENRYADLAQQPRGRLAVGAAGQVTAKNQQVRVELVQERGKRTYRFPHTHVQSGRGGREGRGEALERVHRTPAGRAIAAREHPRNVDASAGSGELTGPSHRAERWRAEVHRHQDLPDLHRPSLIPARLPPLHSMQEAASGIALRRANGIGLRQTRHVP